MAGTSISATVGSPAHPNTELWDNIYQDGRDIWTSTAVDQELLKYLDILTEGKTDLSFLVPMCGKTKAMLSLADKGHRVVGIEWSKLAVKQFFEENNLAYSTQTCNIGGVDMPVYTASNKAISIYCGDIFAFKEHKLDGFDCVLDHGALVSFDINTEERMKYADIISSLTKPSGRMLLSIFEYNQSEHPTIPFAVTEEEVSTLYQKHFMSLELLQELGAAKAIDIVKADPKSSHLTQAWFCELSHFSWKLVFLVKQLS